MRSLNHFVSSSYQSTQYYPAIYNAFLWAVITGNVLINDYFLSKNVLSSHMHCIVCVPCPVGGNIQLFSNFLIGINKSDTPIWILNHIVLCKRELCFIHPFWNLQSQVLKNDIFWYWSVNHWLKTWYEYCNLSQAYLWMILTMKSLSFIICMGTLDMSKNHGWRGHFVQIDWDRLLASF